MVNERMKKVVQMPSVGRSETLVPEVLDQVREVIHRHRHEHFLMPEEPALTPRDFRDIAVGIEALERAANHHHGRQMSNLRLVVVCALASPLVLCGLIKLLSLH
jgi:hypothetical protein